MFTCSQVKYWKSSDVLVPCQCMVKPISVTLCSSYVKKYSLRLVVIILKAGSVHPGLLRVLVRAGSALWAQLPIILEQLVWLARAQTPICIS